MVIEPLKSGPEKHLFKFGIFNIDLQSPIRVSCDMNIFKLDRIPFTQRPRIIELAMLVLLNEKSPFIFTFTINLHVVFPLKE